MLQLKNARVNETCRDEGMYSRTSSVIIVTYLTP